MPIVVDYSRVDGVVLYIFNYIIINVQISCPVKYTYKPRFRTYSIIYSIVYSNANFELDMAKKLQKIT